MNVFERYQLTRQQKTSSSAIWQRDRAAGWVSFCQKWKTGTGRQFYGHKRSVFNHCDVIGHSKAIELGEKRKIRAVTPFKVIHGHRSRYQSKARMRLPISD